MILLFSSKNPASKSIAQILIEQYPFVNSSQNKWTYKNFELIETNVDSILEVPTNFDTDCIIVLSTHKSKDPAKIITAHYPGNWSKAEMGGTPKTLNPTPSSILKSLFCNLLLEADKIGWPISLEADHHGPDSSVPIIYAEIGPNEVQWTDKLAATALANAIMNIDFNKKYPTGIVFGGGHYSKKLNEFLLKSSFALSHIAPKYVIDLIDESLFLQAITKSVEKISIVFVLKDETNLSQKNHISELCKKFNLKMELI